VRKDEMKAPSDYLFIRLMALPGGPIPPQIQERLASEKMEVRSRGNQMIIRHIWDESWSSFLVFLAIVFFVIVPLLVLFIAPVIGVLPVILVPVLILIVIGSIAFVRRRD